MCSPDISIAVMLLLHGTEITPDISVPCKSNITALSTSCLYLVQLV